MSLANPGFKNPVKRATVTQIGKKQKLQVENNKQKLKSNNNQKLQQSNIQQSQQQIQTVDGQIYKNQTSDNFQQYNIIETVEELDQQEVRNGNIDIISGEVQTVFRVAPYRREVLLKHKQNRAIKILFLDEGNSCRSILAEAIIGQILEQLNTPLPVSIHSASIGAPIHDAREDPTLSAVAKTMNLQLPRNKHQIFKEMKDMLNFDLVLVMDRFDYEDVYREVSVMDIINPGTHFTNKVKCLGEFKTMLKGDIDVDSLEINDPLYGALTEEEQMQNMFETAQSIHQAGMGLAAFLLALNKCVPKAQDQSLPSLKEALEQSLECPLLSEHLVTPVLTIMQIKQNIQQINENIQNNCYQQQLPWVSSNQHSDKKIQQRSKKMQYGYWNSVDNIESELGIWMAKHQVCGRMPSQQELRRSGANSLAASIDRQGGFRAIALKLGLPNNQQTAGYWDKPGNLEWELTPYLAKGPDGQIYLPSQQFLQGIGRNDLIGAIRKCGGHKVVAKRLGVNYRHGKYSNLEGLLQEIQSCLKVNGWQQQHRLPTYREFDAIGRSDVANGIKKFGGFYKIAKLLQLDYQVQYKQRTTSSHQPQIPTTNTK